jgi:hypothetical protein
MKERNTKPSLEICAYKLRYCYDYSFVGVNELYPYEVMYTNKANSHYFQLAENKTAGQQHFLLPTSSLKFTGDLGIVLLSTQ